MGRTAGDSEPAARTEPRDRRPPHETVATRSRVSRYRGRSLAAALLKHFLLKVLEVAEYTGVRIALVHAANDTVAGSDRRYGFEPSPIDDLTLMLLVRDIST